MGVKDFFKKVINHEGVQGTNYLSLALTSDKIIAAIWHFQGASQIDFVGYNEKEFHSIDSLIHEAAVAIDTAAKNITTDVSQVVFGLSNYWFEDGKLSHETGEILKNLAKELELDAQAFVPLAASVAHYLSLKGGSKNAIFIGAFEDYTEVSFIKNGTAQSSEHKGKATLEDISRLIGKIKEAPDQELPNQVIIFGDGATHLKKELDKEDGHKVFKDDAKIEILKNEELVRCITYSQVADILGSEPQIVATATQPTTATKDAEEIEPQEERKEQEKVKEEPPESSDEFDFREGLDVLASPPPSSEARETPSSQSPQTASPSDEYAVDIDEKAHGYETPAQKLQESTKPKRSWVESMLTLNWMSSLAKGNKKKIIPPAIILAALLLAALYVLGFTLTSAQVMIRANSKPFEDTFDLTVASGAALDTTRSRMPGEEIIATVQDSSQAQATGIKKTGNYAKGEVKVLNWTTSKVDFNAGTVIITKSGIKFELGSKVEIASRSASTPGESTVAVTAQEFGQNGNVSAGTEFTFQKYDELLYSAKNDNAMAGGDEKEINVVTQKDQDNLAQDLEKSLTQKAKEELRQKVGDKEIFDESIAIKVLKKQFDKQIDQEATAFTLSMEIEASALFYKEETLREFLAKISQDEADDYLESAPENIEILDIKATRDKNSLQLEGEYRANLVPKIDVEAIKANIAGKSQKSAREQIRQNPEIRDVEFIFSPNLILFSSLPKNKDKISIKIEAVK